MSTAPPTTVAPTTEAPSYYSTCFAEYTTGAQPSDWTERWHTGDASATVELSGASVYGGRFLHIDHSAAGRYLLSWDDLDNSDDIEVLALQRWAASGVASAIMGVTARASGSDGSENGYIVYFEDDDNTVLLRKYISGAVTTINSFSHTLSDDEWYWIRFRVSGSSLKVKVWDEGTTEPASWDLEETDSSITGSGWAGVITYKSDWEYTDWFSAATNGGTAQLPGDVSGCTTVPPTTIAPTTLEPTTAAPTTLAPTTEAPTTTAPTTVEPTTVAPTTDLPTTAAPTTQGPTTAGPTTLAPTTLSPSTLAPSTVLPTTVAPTTLTVTTIPPGDRHEISAVSRAYPTLSAISRA